MHAKLIALKLEPKADPPIAFNITHDNGLIAMAFGPGLQLPPAYGIGVDVMKLSIPRRNSFKSFVEGVSDAVGLPRLGAVVLLTGPS